LRYCHTSITLNDPKNQQLVPNYWQVVVLAVAIFPYRCAENSAAPAIFLAPFCGCIAGEGIAPAYRQNRTSVSSSLISRGALALSGDFEPRNQSIYDERRIA
jgi:hypothetical protein